MGTIQRGKVQRGDLANWDGNTSAVTRVDATGGTITGLAVGNEVDVLQVYGSGTARTLGTMSAAVQKISGNVTLVFAPGTWDVTDDITIPSNFTCHVPAGCVFDVTTGKTLTINGHVQAGQYQIFSGAGTIAGLGKNGSVTPIWWQENTTPGTTDMSAAIQAAIDANKGKRVVITEVMLCAGILLDGATYDGTEIICEGAGELKFVADAGQFNFDTSIWACLIVKECDSVKLDLRFDGNRTSMTADEGSHCLILAAATNVYCPSLIFREQRGDGLYIDRASPLNSGAGDNSKNIVVDYLSAYNSADDGRNACSVISCDGLTIGELHSYQVGGVIDSVQMPGGLDLEPNWPAQSVSDVGVGILNVVTAGSVGLGIVGQATTNDATRDWNIQRVKVGSAIIKNTALGFPFIRRARDIDVRVSNTSTGTRGIGAGIDYADRITAHITTKFSTNGLILGTSDYVYDSDIYVNINDYANRGILSAGVGRSKVHGRIYGASSASSTFALNLDKQARTITQTGVIYELDMPYDTNNVFGMYQSPSSEITIGVGTCIRNCDMTGYATLGAAYADWTSSYMPFFNVQGVTNVLDSVASVAGAITLPLGPEIITITGTNTITSITATKQTGKIKRLVFASTAGLTDGSNLKLAGDFAGSADDVVTLLCDGTNWTEISRSAN